jgi:hypothetical protein
MKWNEKEAKVLMANQCFTIELVFSIKIQNHEQIRKNDMTSKRIRNSHFNQRFIMEMPSRKIFRIFKQIQSNEIESNSNRTWKCRRTFFCRENVLKQNSESLIMSNEIKSKSNRTWKCKTIFCCGSVFKIRFKITRHIWHNEIE